MVFLNTVRAKLTALVGLSAVATLASLPILHKVMTGQLVDVVDDRVPDAIRGFELELADDVRDLEAATRSLGDSDELQHALASGDAAAAAEELRVFHEQYSGTALVAYGKTGDPIAQIGLSSAAAKLAAIDGLDAQGRSIAKGGCTATPAPTPAYVLARKVRDAGTVVACMAIDPGYLANSKEKLGVELSLEGSGSAIKTPTFPTQALAAWHPGEALVESDNKAWALARFEPAPLKDVPNRFTVVAALDMTRIRDVVRHNLMLTMGVLVVAAAAAILMGARLASMMSRALARVNVALKKLEQDEYVHVTGVKTGDELEDLASGFNTMVDGLKERDKLRTTFGKYMTQQVMEHLMKGKVQLGGESLTVTILFTDIRGFTTISEAMSAQELVALLNEYFTEMVSIVMQEGGVVDKYIGDAIMAVFGAPVSKPDDAERAVRAAVRMRRALARLNDRLAAKGKPPIKTGIGLHTGEVVAGNIGSEARMEYTVIGDAVNLASRLEGSTKDLGVDVLVSEDTFKAMGPGFVTKPIKEITVKGRAAPVMTYEVKGIVDDRESVKPASA